MRWLEKLVWCVAVPVAVSFFIVNLYVDTKWTEVDYLFFERRQEIQELRDELSNIKLSAYNNKEEVKELSRQAGELLEKVREFKESKEFDQFISRWMDTLPPESFSDSSVPDTSSPTLP